MYMEKSKRRKSYTQQEVFEESESEDNVSYRDTDEDTEDASETEDCKTDEVIDEKKEQAFLEKIASLQKQLQQVADGCHPEYQKRLRRIELVHHERNLFNEVWRQCEIERVQADCEVERSAAKAELEEKTLELQDGLVAEYEEKRRQVETERKLTVELTGDSMEAKTVSTRKLRRRPNEPVQPLSNQEKRRKVSPSQLNLLLDEGEILEDLKLIQRGKFTQSRRGTSSTYAKSTEYDVDLADLGSPTNSPVLYQDVKIEQNRVFYDKKWHYRGQGCFVESREHGRFNATFDTFAAPNEIGIKKVSDGSKVRISLGALQRGKVMLRRK